MESTKIHWKTALELLNNNQQIVGNEIVFEDSIHIKDVILFNKNGINVPEHLIDYDDDNIDCSDIQEITDEDINSGKLIRVLPAQLKIDAETENWMRKSKINYNELISNLLNNFYHSLKTLQTKAAI